MGFDEVADALGFGFAMAVAGDGSVPLKDSMRMSAKTMPVEMWTEATLEMAMLSSLLPNQRDFTRLTRCELITSRVGKRKLPLVQRLAVDMGLWYAGGGSVGRF